MFIPRRAHNAIELLVILAKHPKGSDPLLLASIAPRLGVSLSQLEYIASPLRKMGIVIGFRGPGGGYTLGMSPQEITLNVVIKALGDDEYNSGALGLMLDICMSQYTLQDVIRVRNGNARQIGHLPRYTLNGTTI